MLCIYCGMVIDDNSMTCSFCGNAVPLYATPEGFKLDSQSHLYYRDEETSDASVRWVTWFNPHTGKYDQVSYPAMPPQNMDDIPKVSSAAETFQPVNGKEGYVGSYTPNFYPSYNADATSVFSPPAARNSKKGLAIAVMLVVLLCGAAAVVYLTGFYKNVPFLNPSKQDAGSILIDGNPLISEKVDRIQDSFSCIDTVLTLMETEADFADGGRFGFEFDSEETELALKMGSADSEVWSSKWFGDTEYPIESAAEADWILLYHRYPDFAQYQVRYPLNGVSPDEVVELTLAATRFVEEYYPSYEMLFKEQDVGGVLSEVSGEFDYDLIRDVFTQEEEYHFDSCWYSDQRFLNVELLQFDHQNYLTFTISKTIAAEASPEEDDAAWEEAYIDFLVDQDFVVKDFLHYNDNGAFPVHRINGHELAVMQANFYEIPGFDYPVMVLTEFIPFSDDPYVLDTYHYEVAYLVKDGAVTYETTDEEYSAIYTVDEESGMTFVNGSLLADFQLVAWVSGEEMVRSNLQELYDWLEWQ